MSDGEGYLEKNFHISTDNKNYPLKYCILPKYFLVAVTKFQHFE